MDNFRPGDEEWTFLVGGYDEKGKEIPIGLNDLLDGKYTGNYRKAAPDHDVPVTSAETYSNPIQLSHAARIAAQEFTFRKGEEPFAILLNPVTRMGLQMEYIGIFGIEDGEPTHLHGMLMQAAAFIQEGQFMLASKEDYDKLAREQNIA